METALLAAEFCRKHKLATADAVVFASAQIHGADLVTCDGHFDGLPNVTVLAKVASCPQLDCDQLAQPNPMWTIGCLDVRKEWLALGVARSDFAAAAGH
ncbi:MAG: hypothetical protein Devi2KO_28610 [Devosia indica]